MSRTISLAVVLGLCASAWALPYFQFVPESTDFSPGSTVTFDVYAQGEGLFEGMNLYVEVDQPYTLSNIVVTGPGSGTIWDPGARATVWSYPDPEIPLPQFLVAYAITEDAGIFISAPGIVAKFDLTVPSDAPVGTTGLLTSYTRTPGYAGMYSDWATLEMPGQAKFYVPEPGCAVLLLAGLLRIAGRKRAS